MYLHLFVFPLFYLARSRLRQVRALNYTHLRIYNYVQDTYIRTGYIHTYRIHTYVQDTYIRTSTQIGINKIKINHLLRGLCLVATARRSLSPPPHSYLEKIFLRLWTQQR